MPNVGITNHLRLHETLLLAFSITLTFGGLTTVWGQVGNADAEAPVDETYFAKELYPILIKAQCNLCHSDNGVASGTELEFPSVGSDDPQQVTALGLALMDLVDRDDPQQSLLLLKPTNREEHTGGERIQPDSQAEARLVAWINYLANLSDADVQRARDKIAEARRHGLDTLSIRRLSHSQYNATVRALLGDNSQPANRFPQEDFIHGFKNQAEAQGISPLQAEAYAKAAEQLAASAFRGGDLRGLLPGEAGANECAEAFVRQFGLRAFRRPLTASELRVYVRLFLQSAGPQANRLAGAQMVVETMLQSPNFLFRVQRGTSGTVSEYELASRLSYLLWDTMPTDELLHAAEQGRMSVPGQVEMLARQMLDDPRARIAMEEFLAQWLRFDRVLTATRDRRRYADFTTETATAMVEETRRLFNHLVWDDRNFMEFFTADYTFVNADLARLYGLSQPETDYALVRYPVDSGRSGVLGHGSFLVATSKPSETSPTERGLFVRNQFLGQEVPPPPPGVNTALPEITEDKPMTNRERLQIHLNSEACSSCHRLIDPIGFGFEQYNAVGGFEAQELSGSTNESGNAEVGYIRGIENSAFSTPKQLGDILANNQACQRCIVKQLFRYAFGRAETASDQPVIDDMLKQFRDSGFRFRELLIALVTSDLFLQPGAMQSQASEL